MPSEIACFQGERVCDCSIASVTLVKLLGVLAILGVPTLLGFGIGQVSSNMRIQFPKTLR